MSKKMRADALLVLRGIAEDTAHAMRLIMAGRIVVQHTNHQEKVEKPGTCYATTTVFLDKGTQQYVSRGGYKLETALDHFTIIPKDKVCLDIGASTGGFTDCLLQRGAQKVYAIDVGKNLLHESLRINPRVINKEHTHIAHLSKKDIPEPFSLVVGDLSFISLKHIFSPLIPLFTETTSLLLLVKPQFELPQAYIHNGIAVHTEYHTIAIEHIVSYAQSMNFYYHGYIPSKIKGKKGNQEYIVYLEYRC